MIPVDRVHLGTLLISATRYALGRRTYVVGETCDLVRAYVGAVGAEFAGVILRDIESELARGQVGDPCDHEQWHALAAWLLERRAP